LVPDLSGLSDLPSELENIMRELRELELMIFGWELVRGFLECPRLPKATDISTIYFYKDTHIFIFM
jgi:hypothetical protein